MSSRFCPACYGLKVYCRKHKTFHCDCSWNDRMKCLAEKADAKHRPPSTAADRG